MLVFYFTDNSRSLFSIPSLILTCCFFCRNAPMFRSRGQRGRGVGLARGKATVNRARGQRRG